MYDTLGLWVSCLDLSRFYMPLIGEANIKSFADTPGVQSERVDTFSEYIRTHPNTRAKKITKPSHIIPVPARMTAALPEYSGITLGYVA